MKYMIFIFCGFIFYSLYSAKNSPTSIMEVPISPETARPPYHLEHLSLGSGLPKQRIGYMLESRDAPLKGCIIYLQGFGDSILNHSPLFNKLREAGYRILLFDYLGQGGSAGSMSEMRVDATGLPFPKSRNYEIGGQAKIVWDMFSNKPDPDYRRTCAGSPKLVLGWSVGGLAAYKLAYQKWADGYVLISPALAPRWCIGEAAGKCPVSLLKTDPMISLRTLTSNPYTTSIDPHLNVIRPDSPLKTKQFFISAMTTALASRGWMIENNQKGLVFLPGGNDTYIDRDKVGQIIKSNASGFALVFYDNALHEIDNELPSVSRDMHARTVQFFDSIVRPKN